MKGIVLKVKRIEKGIKAIAVAKALGVSPSYVSYMENDKKPIPSELLPKWLVILGLQECF